MLQKFSGATIRRVIDRSGVRIPEHAHDWPVLSLFVLGGYLNRTELGEASIGGPSAVLYRAGAYHQNTIASSGFEQIEIEFDEAWLRSLRLPDVPVSRWLGAVAGAEARTLARDCHQELTEAGFRQRIERLLERAIGETQRIAPGWLGPVTERLRNDPTLSVGELAVEAQRHPSWLGTAYRRAAGESLLGTAARFRVEHAARLLRETDLPMAQIALDAAFCDQSHMSRTFTQTLGRSPYAVRQDRQDFRQSPPN